MTARTPPHAKTGTGRYRQTQRVPDVESVPCPSRPGPHWLIWRRGVIVCRGCKATWAALDEAVRAS